MRQGVNGQAMLVWAAREIQRHPGRHGLILVSLAGLIAIAAAAVLFSQALDTTWQRLMDQAPDLVIRRVDTGGWAPMPAAEAIDAAGSVPGVIEATPRVWGVVSGPQEPVTVLASKGLLPDSLLDGLAPPAPGQAVVGRSVFRSVPEGRLTLTGQTAVTVSVVGTFPLDSGLATDDLVWVSKGDARALLGLPDGQASDLAVYLFREGEQQAIQADLATAFPWSVNITDRRSAALQLHTQAMRLGGTAVASLIPALLALLLIIIATTAGGRSRQAQWGLFKALGWTTADVVRLRAAEAAIIFIPATALGLASAVLVVYYPPAAGLAALWFTGGRHVTDLVLSSSGTLLTMLVIVVLVGLPYLAAVLLTTVKETNHDPWHLLQEEPWN